MKPLSYTDVFQGFDEMALPSPKGVASTWFFLKAQCGNTSPAALLPFGRMSVGPYSGGYPTGYGDRKINCSAIPKRFADGNRPFGFSHLHHSGTGAVGYYYNYALAVPFYDAPGRKTPSGERAVPGLYEITLDDIACSVTADANTALHRYVFAKPGGKILLDFANDGLTEDHGNFSPTSVSVRQFDRHTVCARVKAQGIWLYFAASCENARADLSCFKAHTPENRPNGGETAAVFTLANGQTALLRVALSLTSEEAALSFLENGEKSFDSAAKAASAAWEKALSVIEIDADEEIKQIFYSNLYHSLVKPADFSGESFLYGGGGPFVTDLITLWDLYKTQLPLLFTFFPKISEKICETLMTACETLGFIPNSLGLSDNYAHEAGQARMLGGYALLSAYHFGVPMDPRRMLRAIHRDLHHPDKTDFTKHGRCRSHTWALDMADCCAWAADVAHALSETALHADFSRYAGLLSSVFDPDTGLLYADSSYYEGSHANYSFRLCNKMDERIQIAGGKARFVALLDHFFGFGAEPVVQPTDPHDGAYIGRGLALGRFEGFNNEPDMETPYAYLFAGRHDRACEVLRLGMDCMFTTGRGGLPGNNDGGALSSCYVWNALGLFPVAGSGRLLLGSPIVNGAILHLPGEKALEIAVYGNNRKAVTVEKACWNGEALSDFSLPVSVLQVGGRLEFFMRKG